MFMVSISFVSWFARLLMINFYLLFLFLFRHPSPSVLIPALRTVGNIVTGDDVQTQVFSLIHLT